MCFISSFDFLLLLKNRKQTTKTESAYYQFENYFKCRFTCYNAGED